MIQKNEILAGITGMRQVASQLMKWADDMDVQPIHYIPLRDAAAALGADEEGGNKYVYVSR